jgi:predicted methyltransferase
MRGIHSALALLLAVFPVSVSAEPADVRSAVESWARPDELKPLDIARKPIEVLTFLGVERGDRALDLFGSTGYYGPILALAVGPEGSVDAWEAANFVTSKTRRKWDELGKGIPNLKLIVSPARRLELPENSYDFVMFNLNYHDLYWESAEYRFPRMDPKPFVEELYRSMKPGAVIGIIDHIASPGGNVREVAQKLHRIDPERVKSDFLAAGFVLDGESAILRNSSDDHSKNVFDEAVRLRTDQMILRFRKPR